jgi:xylose isomerase
MDQMIDNVGLAAIQAVIDQNDAVAANQLLLEFLSPTNQSK